jgi:hypothetical protein
MFPARKISWRQAAQPDSLKYASSVKISYMLLTILSIVRNDAKSFRFWFVIPVLQISKQDADNKQQI